MSKLKIIISGDAMITDEYFENAYEKYLKDCSDKCAIKAWETDFPKLQDRRLIVEQQGPEVETVPEVVLESGSDANVLMGLFVPVSSKVMDAMPNLRIVGLARAGLENINLAEANKRGILVFNIMGRNAEAVSDFAVGLMLCESRNIARSHISVMDKGWRKEFSNSSFVPQLKDKNIGIAGLGYIGRLVAQKLKGFGCNILAYEPFLTKEAVEAMGYRYVDKETLFKESDFVSLHLRMTEATKHFVDKDHLAMMKKTSYIVNTGRSGLIDMDALYNALANKDIAGAGLDVFDKEPLGDSPFLGLDNVTLTSHIAGSTTEVFTKSPHLLMDDIRNFLDGKDANFIVNKEVLEHPEFKAWFKEFKNAR